MWGARVLFAIDHPGRRRKSKSDHSLLRKSRNVADRHPFHGLNNDEAIRYLSGSGRTGTLIPATPVSSWVTWIRTQQSRIVAWVEVATLAVTNRVVANHNAGLS